LAKEQPKNKEFSKRVDYYATNILCESFNSKILCDIKLELDLLNVDLYISEGHDLSNDDVKIYKK
jgi:hypothetical protein